MQYLPPQAFLPVDGYQPTASWIKTVGICNRKLRAEVCNVETFLHHRRNWEDLARRAAHPNVFMDPAAVQAAESSGYVMHVVLVWLDSDFASMLIGAWALRSLRRSLRLPFSSLCTTVNRLTYDGTPVLDRAHVEPALSAIISAVQAHPSLPKLILANDVYANGAMLPALRSVLHARRIPVVVVERRRRAVLATTEAPEEFFNRTRSSKGRSEERRLRRRLTEIGGVFRPQYEPADVAATFEQFLALEMAGWKGRAAAGGHAIRREPRLENFARTMIAGLAQCGAVEGRTISVGGRTIAATIILKSGFAAIGWKIAFDAAFGAFSPGSLLVDEVARALMTDPVIELFDSGNRDEGGPHARLWPDRQDIVDLVFDMGSLAGWKVRLVAGTERLTRALRAHAARLRSTIFRRVSHAVTRGSSRGGARPTRADPGGPGLESNQAFSTLHRR